MLFYTLVLQFYLKNGQEKEGDTFLSQKKPKRKQNKKTKKTEKKRDSCRWKTSSEVEIKRNRLNKEIKNFI